MKTQAYIVTLVIGCMMLLFPQEACAGRFGFSKFSLFFWQNQNSFTLQSRLVQRTKVRRLTRESRELRSRRESPAKDRILLPSQSPLAAAKDDLRDRDDLWEDNRIKKRMREKAWSLDADRACPQPVTPCKKKESGESSRSPRRKEECD